MYKALIGILSGLIVLVGQIWRTWPDEYVHLVFCDVGQGDAILITAGFNQVLIDGGPNEQVLDCLEEQLPFWDRQLELVVATHADADHIGGLPAVLRLFDVKSMVMPQYDKETVIFSELKTAVAQAISEGMVLKTPILGAQMSFSQEDISLNEGQEHFLPTLTFTTLSPQEVGVQKTVQNSLNPEDTLSDVEWFFEEELPQGKNYNDLSIVLFLEIGQVKVLLAGDMEEKGEIALLQAGLTRLVNIIKVGHHGAKTGSSSDFLMSVRPEVSVISVGANNKYGHPSPEVMSRLIQLSSEILRTDELGTVEIKTDGVEYWVMESKKR